MGVCEPGWADCDMMFSNGCETNIQTDSNNCGSCGVACPAGAECMNGACVALDGGAGG
jgi:hypothetical protein